MGKSWEDAIHAEIDPSGVLWYSNDLIEIPIPTILLATDRIDR